MNSEGRRLSEEAARRLALTGRYQIGPGLTDTEIARIERDCRFEFADDHRAFLAAGLPLNNSPEIGQAWSAPWPDWRDGGPGDLHKQLGWSIEGVLFDVGNGLWLPAWGQRPAQIGPRRRWSPSGASSSDRRTCQTSMANGPAAFANQSEAFQIRASWGCKVDIFLRFDVVAGQGSSCWQVASAAGVVHCVWLSSP